MRPSPPPWLRSARCWREAGVKVVKVMWLPSPCCLSTHPLGGSCNVGGSGMQSCNMGGFWLPAFRQTLSPWHGNKYILGCNALHIPPLLWQRQYPTVTCVPHSNMRCRLLQYPWFACGPCCAGCGPEGHQAPAAGDRGGGSAA